MGKLRQLELLVTSRLLIQIGETQISKADLFRDLLDGWLSLLLPGFSLHEGCRLAQLSNGAAPWSLAMFL